MAFDKENSTALLLPGTPAPEKRIIHATIPLDMGMTLGGSVS